MQRPKACGYGKSTIGSDSRWFSTRRPRAPKRLCRDGRGQSPGSRENIPLRLRETSRRRFRHSRSGDEYGSAAGKKFAVKGVETSLPTAPVPTNRLLAMLPGEDRRRLEGELQGVAVRPGQVLQRQAERVQRVYFLHSGLCSIGRETASGQTVEVASVGNEGLVGITAVLGNAAQDGTQTTVIVGGDASWMSFAALRREMNRRGSLHDLVQRYLQAFVASLVTAAACHALHRVEQRLARWLLEAEDRLRTTEIPLTQETVASLLGVRRASITVATTILGRLGLIEHAHKRIRLHDRVGLQVLACECYAATRLSLARLLVSPRGAR